MTKEQFIFWTSLMDTYKGGHYTAPQVIRELISRPEYEDLNTDGKITFLTLILGHVVFV